MHFAFVVTAGVDLNQLASEIACYLELGRFRWAAALPSVCEAGKRSGLMRAVIKLTLVGMATFAVAFAARRVFFWDVMPVSWTGDSSPTGALMAAYLLLSLENVGVGLATIAAVAGLAALARPLITKRSRSPEFDASPVVDPGQAA